MIDKEVIIWIIIGLLSVLLTLLLVVLVDGALKPRESSLQEILLQPHVKNLIRNARYSDNIIRSKRSDPDSKNLHSCKSYLRHSPIGDFVSLDSVRPSRTPENVIMCIKTAIGN
jgi:hypothetical protein